jgi:hypothetical protein
MAYLPDEYLSILEDRAKTRRAEDYNLWPRTVIGDSIQDKIEERVGVSDYAVKSPRSRSALILGQIAAMIRTNAISANFSIIDIACGDAVILLQIKKANPTASCYGVDLHKGAFSAHQEAEAAGVRLYRAFLQHLFAEPPAEPFDLALMLNTYRNWEAADLRQHERDLPRQADTWLARAARFVIVTATGAQIADWHRRGFTVQTLGKGEDRSTLVCFSRLPLPTRSWRDWLGRGRQ